MISAIAALSTNRVIGKNNTLPWYYPEDLKHFKTITTGKTILMGRKTYDSIGKALPNRTNIVLTRDMDRSADGVETIHTIDHIITQYQHSDEELVIIGGEQIYTLFLPYISTLYLTEIKTNITGDAFFPEFNDHFTQTEREEKEAYDFVQYERVATTA